MQYLLRTAVIALIFSWFGLNASAQDGKRKYKELFSPGLKMDPSAMHLGLGINRLMGPFGGTNQFSWESGDTTFNSLNTTKGGFGLYLEGGYSRFFKSNPLMDELSITGAFMQRTGSQTHESELVLSYDDAENDTVFYEGNGYFDHTYVSLAFTGHQHLQITDKKYWSIGYGADFNYRMFNTTNYIGDHDFEEHRMPGDFMANFHVRLGYGFYWKSMILMNPAITVPVVSTLGIGPVQYFSNRYQPVMLSLRFIWLKKPKSMECPAIKPNSGERVKKSYYLQELFHPDSRNNVKPEKDDDR